MNKLICHYCGEEADWHFQWEFWTVHSPKSVALEFGNHALYHVCNKCKDKMLKMIDEGINKKK